MTRRLLVLVVLLGLIGPMRVRPASAVLGVGDAVYDYAVHVESITTAVKTTATAANTAEIIANQILELTALEEWALDAGMAEDLQQIQELVSQAEGLAWDIDSLNAQITQLFDLDGAPMTSLEFRERQVEIRRYLYQSWSYAMRTQTLIRTLLSTVNHILGIYASVKGIIGNKQGLQTMAQYQAKIVQTLAEMNLHTAALHRAQSVQGINDPLIAQSIDNMNEGILNDWAEGDTGP
jgi:conjugal transfer/entry exclusion protein